jgi:hypothetical protein
MTRLKLEEPELGRTFAQVDSEFFLIPIERMPEKD